VHDLAAHAVEHEVRRMSVAEAEDVADHRHDSEGASVVCATIKPSLKKYGVRLTNYIERLGCIIFKVVNVQNNFVYIYTQS